MVFSKQPLLIATGATPASAFDATTGQVNGGAVNGAIWCDDQYLYRRASNGHILSMPFHAVPGDPSSSAGVAYAKNTVSLASGTATVTTTAATTASVITLSYSGPSGTLGILAATKSAGSFVINSYTSAGAINTADNSQVSWTIPG